MASTVSVRQVNQQTSLVFNRVLAGEELVVTRRGRPEARIIPFKATDAYEQMVASGQIIPAKATAQLNIEPVRVGVDLDQFLDQERADRGLI